MTIFLIIKGQIILILKKIINILKIPCEVLLLFHILEVSEGKLNQMLNK